MAGTSAAIGISMAGPMLSYKLSSIKIKNNILLSIISSTMELRARYGTTWIYDGHCHGADELDWLGRAARAVSKLANEDQMETVERATPWP
jgi:hypothetical protein